MKNTHTILPMLLLVQGDFKTKATKLAKTLSSTEPPVSPIDPQGLWAGARITTEGELDNENKSMPSTLL